MTNRSGYLVVAVGLMMTALSTDVMARMIGKDNRTIVPNEFREIASRIGRLRMGNAKCTAFCVAPNAIVTNAHCIAHKFNKKTKKRRVRTLWNMSFTLGGKWSNIEWQQIEPLGNPYLSVVTVPLKKSLIRSRVNDWAIARLETPICQGGALRFASDQVLKRIYRRGGIRVMTIGYPRDWRGRQAFQKCWMANPKTRAGNTSFPHLCDSVGGQSGSPMLTKTRDGWRVVAVHRGDWLYGKRSKRVRFGPGKLRRYRRISSAVSIAPVKKLLPAFLDMTFVAEKMKQRTFQRLLQRGRVYKGRVSDKVSPRLWRAIRRYQNRNDMVPLGIPTRAMIEKLRTMKRK